MAKAFSELSEKGDFGFGYFPGRGTTPAFTGTMPAQRIKPTGGCVFFRSFNPVLRGSWMDLS